MKIFRPASSQRRNRALAVPLAAVATLAGLTTPAANAEPALPPAIQEASSNLPQNPLSDLSSNLFPKPEPAPDETGSKDWLCHPSSPNEGAKRDRVSPDFVFNSAFDCDKGWSNGETVTLDGNPHLASAVATPAGDSTEAHGAYHIGGKYHQLHFKVAFAEDFGPVAEEGILRVTADGKDQEFRVKRGDVYEVSMDITGVEDVRVDAVGVKPDAPDLMENRVSPCGLAMLTPTMQ